MFQMAPKARLIVYSVIPTNQEILVDATDFKVEWFSVENSRFFVFSGGRHFPQQRLAFCRQGQRSARWKCYIHCEFFSFYFFNTFRNHHLIIITTSASINVSSQISFKIMKVVIQLWNLGESRPRIPRVSVGCRSIRAPSQVRQWHHCWSGTNSIFFSFKLSHIKA